MERVHIYHTNDIHSHFENWPRISAYLREESKRLEQENETVFLFDIGDACDRVHPFTEATDGKANILLLNEVEYDAVTIGNNEGIGSSKKQLNHLYDEANFPVVISNLYDDKTGYPPEWAKLFHIVQTKTGHKIGLFGLTAPFPTSYKPIGWNVKNPDEVIGDMLELLSPLVDSIILLSHLGIGEDKRIAEMYPMISIIIGSHTHHLLPNGEIIRNTLLAAAGKYGQYVGHIELEIDGNKIKTAKATVKETATMQAPKNERLVIESYEKKGHQLLMEQIIATVPDTFSVSWQGSSELVTLGLEALKEYAHTDAAILNAGLFMQPLIEGTVTKDALHEILPHPMRILRCTLNGEDLIRMIYEMEKNRLFLRNFPIKGIGFRGQIFGEICYNGVTYDKMTGEVCWLDKPIEPDKQYTFATVDHFMFIPFFPTIEIKGKNEVLFPYFIRNVLELYLKKHYPADKSTE
ncbi:bifunctional metallophosphatase/5'-nucleotidase [Carnobacterium jeotgali]|uniref:bifunctional metallophosphatase/5'-nucleotidase n=1 Tax=Carnobacterium jeotgali TaxID=545534 RepID=UPI000492F8ED|nr:bifunctional UDP-sugar hydrolase/5'-nucleotidase [Carnobacterium jeotgali]